MRKNVLQGEAPRKVLQIKVESIRKYNLLSWQQVVFFCQLRTIWALCFKTFDFFMVHTYRGLLGMCLVTNRFNTSYCSSSILTRLANLMKPSKSSPSVPQFGPGITQKLRKQYSYIEFLKIYVALNCLPLIICFLFVFRTTRQWRGLARLAIYQNVRNV